MCTLPKSLNFGRNLRENVENFVLHLLCNEARPGINFFPSCSKKK